MLYTVSGEYDYILRVVAPGLAEIEEFIMHRLLRQKCVKFSQYDIRTQAEEEHDRTTVAVIRNSY